ncbi:MAG: hypothetical protein JWP03_59 [Phycisphaerales bacterium]|jgi:hypothetical protein|nr:hypothetical protein [Phycisphaerales bacterium]
MGIQPIDPKLVRSVGDPFITGDVDEQVFERLCELTQDPPQFIWPAHGGITRCKHCRFTGGGDTKYNRLGSGGGSQKSYTVYAVTQGVLWVPGEGFLWRCARTITHAIDAHGYCPPHEFCEAVLRCPPMRSMEYLKAVLANGGRELHFGNDGA